MPARKKPRLEKPIATATGEATTKTASPNIAMDLPPPTATEDTTIRRSSCNTQTQLPRTETSEAQLDGNDDAATDDDDEDANAVVGDSSCPSWDDRFRELAVYRRINGHCNVPRNYSENTKLVNWVRTQRTKYKVHREGKTSRMTIPRIQALESLDFEWDSHGAAWEDRLSELANYRKIHGHCNVPQNYSENTKLANWVAYQRHQYKLQHGGKTSQMTFPRIQALESLHFEWTPRYRYGATSTWQDHLSELANYRKIHGHCNVPRNYSENSKLAKWVAYQRQQYKLQQGGQKSPITLSRIQELENLDFAWVAWDPIEALWKHRLSELVDYRKINGHCNVSQSHSEKSKLAKWVSHQRTLQELESLGFEWDSHGAAWEDRLGELADYRKIYGCCNVPPSYSENTKLANWVHTQRKQYKLHAQGKKSLMTPFRIQELESLGFEWDRSISQGKGL
jgi:predicted chitinase